MDLNFQPAPFLWVEEGNGQVTTPRTRRRTKKKKQFLGWGSKQLIGFLKSIGRETGQPMSQHDITNIINQYINEKKLLHPEKKKKVMCDEGLHALFGRKSVNRIKIHDLLEEHLAENQVASDDDLFYSSEEDEEVVPASSKRQKFSSSDKKAVPKKKVVEVPKSSLAAISPDNMKLVYLRRTLVQELLKDLENFESKVVGSFVRVKSDPLDIFQKNSHVIELVTGVKSAGDNTSHTLLQISGATDNVSISALSDDNCTEEECDDLRQRMKDGLLKQPTIGELEEKVKVLHEDITKHWLARELVLLKNLIDRANEKGWRHRVTEYLDRRKLLQTPAEQSRLLNEIPKVMPEEVKPDTPAEGSPDASNQEADALNQEADDSPKAVPWDWEECYDSPNRGVMLNFSSVPENQENVEIATRVNGHTQSSSIIGKEGFSETEAKTAKSNGNTESFELRERVSHREEPATAPENNVQIKTAIPDHIALSSCKTVIETTNGRSNQSPALQEVLTKPTDVHRALTQTSNGHLQPLNNIQPQNSDDTKDSQKKPTVVIDLSDDDDDVKVQVAPSAQPQMITDFQDLLMWHYVDPRGIVQGPFSLASMKRWRDAKYFDDKFRVWAVGQSLSESVLLIDILQRFFPS